MSLQMLPPNAPTMKDLKLWNENWSTQKEQRNTVLLYANGLLSHVVTFIPL